MKRAKMLVWVRQEGRDRRGGDACTPGWRSPARHAAGWAAARCTGRPCPPLPRCSARPVQRPARERRWPGRRLLTPRRTSTLLPAPCAWAFKSWRLLLRPGRASLADALQDLPRVWSQHRHQPADVTAHKAADHAVPLSAPRSSGSAQPRIRMGACRCGQGRSWERVPGTRRAARRPARGA